MPAIETYAPERVQFGGREFWSVGGRVIRFIEGHCRLTKGRWRGKPFLLEPWQKREIYRIFEVERQPDGRWLRRYRWAYLEVAKKNGKTEMIAAIDLYLLLADDEESPEIACGSNSDEQADLVFGAAKAMCELSPSLAPLVSCFAKEIVRKDNPAAVLMRVSAKAKTKDGLNLSGVTLDELHEFDEGGENLFNILTNGTAAREQPLVLMITTAGFDEETLCGRYHAHAEKVIAGEVADHAFYASIYAASDPDVNIMDDAALDRALREANPSYGVTTHLPFYLDARRKGPANFKRYFLDIWTAAESQWLPEGAWAACAAPTIAFSAGEPVFCGVDASTKHDSTALVAAQWRPVPGGPPHLLARARVWERPLNSHTGKPDEDWRVPGGEVAEAIRALHTAHPGSVFAYDPAFVTWLAADLAAEGVAMLEMPQTNARMCPPTKALYELIVERRLEHDGDRAFARHVASAVEITTLDGKQRLAKNRGKKRRMIDAAIGLVMATAVAQEPAPAPEHPPTLHLADEDLDAAATAAWEAAERAALAALEGA